MIDSNFKAKYENYVNQKKELYDLLLEYIENQEDEDFNLQNFIKYIEDSELLKDREETKLLLRLILKISKYHYRSPNFIEKIENLLLHYQKEIKQTFSNSEIFKIFQNNKRILLFLFEQKIINTDDEIINKILEKKDKNDTKYCHFFYPEIESFLKEKDSSKVASIKQELLDIDPNIFISFEEKRKQGENDSYICYLIRNDLIVDFISHVTSSNMKLSNTLIKSSIFETNSYLIKHQTSLIEYAAFYGSIQIFQYLKINGVPLIPVLWFYVIHSNNAEMFHLLEENHVSTIFHGSYSKCLQAAIQFHKTNVVDYVLDNIVKKSEISQEEHNTYDENRINYSFHYINFAYFPNEIDNNFVFFYLCQYDYYNLAVIFLENKKIDLNETVNAITFIYIFLVCFLYQYFFHVISKKNFLMEFKHKFCFNSISIFIFFFINNVPLLYTPLEIAYLKDNKNIVDLLLKQGKVHISENKKFVIKLSIPSSKQNIDKYEYEDFMYLREVIFEQPSSVTIFGKGCFKNCVCLKEIRIPSSVKKIKTNAFLECKALEKVTFEEPSSLEVISNEAFSYCDSLRQITIPSSVKLIECCAFYFCRALAKIKIMSSNTKFDQDSFFVCLCAEILINENDYN